MVTVHPNAYVNKSVEVARTAHTSASRAVNELQASNATWNLFNRCSFEFRLFFFDIEKEKSMKSNNSNGKSNQRQCMTSVKHCPHVYVNEVCVNVIHESTGKENAKEKK